MAVQIYATAHFQQINNRIIPWSVLNGTTSITGESQDSVFQPNEINPQNVYNLDVYWEPLTNPTIEGLTNESMTVTLDSPPNQYTYFCVQFTPLGQQYIYKVDTFECHNQVFTYHCTIDLIYTVLIPYLYTWNFPKCVYTIRRHKSPWVIINDTSSGSSQYYPDIDYQVNSFVLHQQTPPTGRTHWVASWNDQYTPMQEVATLSTFAYKVSKVYSGATGDGLSQALVYSPALGTDGYNQWSYPQILQNSTAETLGLWLLPLSLQNISPQIYPESQMTGVTNNQESCYVINWETQPPFQPTWSSNDFLNTTASNWWGNICEFGTNNKEWTMDYALLSVYLTLFTNGEKATWVTHPSTLSTVKNYVTYANNIYEVVPTAFYLSTLINWFGHTQLTISNQYPNAELNFYFNKNQSSSALLTDIPYLSIPLNQEVSVITNSWNTFYNENKKMIAGMSTIRYLQQQSNTASQVGYDATSNTPLSWLKTIVFGGYTGITGKISDEVAKNTDFNINRKLINLNYSNTYGEIAKWRMMHQGNLTTSGNYVNILSSQLSYNRQYGSLWDTALFLQNQYYYGFEIGAIENMMWTEGWTNFTWLEFDILESLDWCINEQYSTFLKQYCHDGFWVNNYSQVPNLPTFDFLSYLENPTAETLSQYVPWCPIQEPTTTPLNNIQITYKPSPTKKEPS